MTSIFDTLLVAKASPKDIVQRLKAAPKTIRSIISDESTFSLIDQIVNRYFLNRNSAQDLMILITLYVLNYVSAQEFVDYAATLTKTGQWHAFANEMETRFWSLYETFLEKEGIIYKQISRLEPRPIKPPEPEPGSPPTLQSVDTLKATAPPPPLTTPLPGQPPKPIPPELIVIGQTQAETIPVPKPVPLAPTPYTPTQTPRIKLGDLKISQQAPASSIPQPPQPVFMGVKFEPPVAKPEIPSEIKATSEKKEIQIPEAPIIPKTQIQGKEVIDLTTFTLRPDQDKQK